MTRGLKNGVLGLVLLLVFLHGMALFIFLAPISVLINFASGSTPSFVSLDQIPSPVQQSFSFIQGPSQLHWDASGTFWQQLNRKILELRYKKMKNEARKELALNVLPFGEGIYGLGAGALYYFKKPLNQLTDEEIVNLAGFYRVFGDVD